MNLRYHFLSQPKLSMLRQCFICCLQHTWWVLPSNCRASFNLLTWHIMAPTRADNAKLNMVYLSNIQEHLEKRSCWQICTDLHFIFPDREFLQTTSKCSRFKSFGVRHCQYSQAVKGVSWVQEILDLSPSHTPRFVTWHCAGSDLTSSNMFPLPRVPRGLECPPCHLYHLRTCQLCSGCGRS